MEFNIVEKLLGMTLLGSEWVLWMLIGLSVISLAVIFERLIFFTRTGVDFAKLSRDVSEQFIKEDIDKVQQLCERTPSIEAQVVLRGLEFKAKGAKAMEQSMSSFIASERQKLDHGLVILGTLGNNAPFIGLFGTVIGIIQAFNDLANNPAGGPSVVMAGISEALVATAVGLLVAIPAVIAYNGFLRLVKRRVANAEAMKRLLVAQYSN